MGNLEITKACVDGIKLDILRTPTVRWEVWFWRWWVRWWWFQLRKNRVNRAFIRAHQAVVDDLRNKLASGKLIARGVSVPDRIAVNPIPKAEWRFLQFDPAMTVAGGRGVAYVDLQIRQYRSTAGKPEGV